MVNQIITNQHINFSITFSRKGLLFVMFQYYVHKYYIWTEHNFQHLSSKTNSVHGKSKKTCFCYLNLDIFFKFFAVAVFSLRS